VSIKKAETNPIFERRVQEAQARREAVMDEALRHPVAQEAAREFNDYMEEIGRPDLTADKLNKEDAFETVLEYGRYKDDPKYEAELLDAWRRIAKGYGKSAEGGAQDQLGKADVKPQPSKPGTLRLPTQKPERTGGAVGQEEGIQESRQVGGHGTTRKAIQQVVQDITGRNGHARVHNLDTLEDARKLGLTDK
jgi:hypothetical protein